jgi:hypothetical protein
VALGVLGFSPLKAADDSGERSKSTQHQRCVEVCGPRERYCKNPVPALGVRSRLVVVTPIYEKLRRNRVRRDIKETRALIADLNSG